MRKQRIAVATASMVLLAVAGCGGSSSSNQTTKFKTGFASATGQLRQTSRAIGTAIEQARSQTNHQILVTFRALASRWQTQLSELETLKPPSNIATDFNSVTGAASRVEADLNGIVAAAATNNAASAKQAAASLVFDITAAKSSATTIDNKLGIK